MLTNVMLTNLILFSLLIRVARYLLGQPACAGSFHVCGGGKRSNYLSLAWSSQASLGQSKKQPFAKITTFAALREEASSAKPVKPFNQKDVCQKALVNREVLDAYFAQMANEDDELNEMLFLSGPEILKNRE